MTRIFTDQKSVSICVIRVIRVLSKNYILLYLSKIRFASSAEKMYIKIIIPITSKKLTGKRVNPNSAANGENGIKIVTASTSIVAQIR